MNKNEQFKKQFKQSNDFITSSYQYSQYVLSLQTDNFN